MYSESKMKHYLTLIKKSDFTDLFRFGYAYIAKSRVIEFDGQVEKLSEDEAIKDRLFAFPNPIDYSFTVLIVHFSGELDENGYLDIESVQNIFALDEQAKKEIEISYDSRIKIQNPVWPEVFKELEYRFFFEDLKKGAKNIWKILHIPAPINEVNYILSDSDIKTLITYMGDDKKLEGKHSFWVYLMHYQRHAYFPKNSLGLFFDLINVYLNTLKGQELPGETTESTNIYHLLEKIPEGYQNSVIKIIDYLSKNSDGNFFLSKIGEISDGIIDAPIIAILFLKFKEQFKHNFNLTQSSRNIIDYAFKNYAKETPYALYLLGLYLGNTHTFECLYDSLPLPIFKQEQEDETKPVDEEGASVDPDPFRPETDKKDNIEGKKDFLSDEKAKKVKPEGPVLPEAIQPGLFDDERSLINTDIPASYPISMRKIGRGGRAKNVKSREEYEKLIRQGYKIVDK